MRPRRALALIVPAVLGCYSLLPGTDLPDAASVDAPSTDIATDRVDASRDDIVDASSAPDTPDTPDTPAPADVIDVVDAVDAPVATDVVDAVVTRPDAGFTDVPAAMDVVDVFDARPDAGFTDVPAAMDVVDVFDARPDLVDVGVTDAPVDRPDVTDGGGADVADAATFRVTPLWPPGLSTVSTLRPTFRWTPPPEAVTVQVCRTRDCAGTTVHRSPVRILNNSYQPGGGDELPQGTVLFWRLLDGNDLPISPTWEFRTAVATINVDARLENAFGVSNRDINLDGFDDLAVGAPGIAGAVGTAYFFVGAAAFNGQRPTPSSRWTPNPGYGYDLAFGDFNGNSRADLLVSSWDPSAPAGAVEAVSLVDGFVTVTALRCGVRCNTNHQFGRVLSAGDLNGDGIDDMLVGAPNSAPGPAPAAGIVEVFYGNAMGLSADANVVLYDPINGYTPFPSSLAVLGDVDGDGYGDFGVGVDCDRQGTTTSCASSAQGRFYLYFGGPRGIDPVNVIAVVGAAQARLGRRIAPAGDVDRDGYADFLVAGTATTPVSADPPGVVRLYRGGPRESLRSPTVLQTFQLAGSVAFGASMAAADLNGDQRVDIVIGAPGREDSSTMSYHGTVAVWLQIANGVFASTPIQLPNVESGASLFGYRVSAAGDLNGDGLGDIVVTAPGTPHNAAPRRAGAMSVWFGNTPGVLVYPDYRLVHTAADAELGRGLAQ